MAWNAHDGAGPSPGIELVLELVRDGARGRRCTACGRSLGEASVEPRQVDPEEITARLLCSCGAEEVVAVRPLGEAGHAELR